jgi:hypothetical protein
MQWRNHRPALLCLVSFHSEDVKAKHHGLCHTQWVREE